MTKSLLFKKPSELMGEVFPSHPRAKIVRDEVALFVDGKEYYRIDMGRCKTAKEFADWTFQLMRKTWVDEELMFHFLLAIKEYLRKQYDVDAQDYFMRGL